MHVDVFGQSFLIVSTLKIAEDLLEKRSSIYSDRPHFVRFTPFNREEDAYRAFNLGYGRRSVRINFLLNIVL